jgi:hypothetical protein
MTTFFTQENTISDTTIKDDALGVALPAEAPPAARKAGAPAGRPACRAKGQRTGGQARLPRERPAHQRAGKTNNGMAITFRITLYLIPNIPIYPYRKGWSFPYKLFVF